ncbi:MULTISPECIES: ABC transporter permease [unclassified Novosphingobium]|nr:MULTISPECIES: ABC transporter permease [unclassified Novosphingobium]MDR6709823.1 erythritol transport system permease protein [Novosphingobium sp. 1748]ODU83104.1 MAG: sugar ABC transporter permease [Novosphingobium sp. SCN 63-17]OJX88154.1 MAG: sugar ABC transporter permease [Novosphingobium sp. 63-713]
MNGAGQAVSSDYAMTLLLKFRTVLALVLVVAIFAVLAPNFLTVANALIMLKHIAIVAILAIGMSFVILTGGIDLSVGSIAGLAGMVAGALIINGLPLTALGVVVYPSVPVVVGLVLLVGIGIGLFNGLLINRFQVAPFIATLGTLYMARGAAMLMSNGETFPNLIGNPALGNEGFSRIGAGLLLGIPAPVWLLAVIAAGAAFVAGSTTFGRRVYAVGGSERAALLSGVRVDRVKYAVYAISGAMAALVGVLIASDLVAAHPASGESFELNGIAAVVLGGASLTGGRGTIVGTLIGACVIGVLGDGMVMVGISEFWQMVIKGGVIVTAVVLDRLQERLG